MCVGSSANWLNSRAWVQDPYKFLLYRILFIIIYSAYFYSASSRPLLYSKALTDTVFEFDAEAPQATASEGLAQGPYTAARAGVEPTTLLTKGVESTNEQPRPTI